MNFVSLFSGIEAASVAWLPLGWKCLAVAEIEKFPCAVLKHYYPCVPNLGDVTKVTEAQIRSLGHVDAVVFGFPCQDLSVAGKRAGLMNSETGEATRSGLFFTAMRIVRWSNARWAIAENVPGLFSSESGRDFAAVAGEMAGVRVDVPDSGWRNAGVLVGPDGLVEWATLDAQYFGVPQRRRRIFLVRDSGKWRSRPPVLFERHSLSGYPPPRRETRQTAPTLPCLSLGGGGLGTDFDCDGGLITHSLRADGFDASGDGTGRGTPIIPMAIRTANTSANGHGLAEDVSHTLDGAQGQAVATMVGEGDAHSGFRDADGLVPVAHMAVRRLTPLECERLQGFPDGWTKISDKTADGPRYKALGNSMAVPVMRWIGERIAMVDVAAMSTADRTESKSPEERSNS